MGVSVDAYRKPHRCEGNFDRKEETQVYLFLGSTQEEVSELHSKMRSRQHRVRARQKPLTGLLIDYSARSGTILDKTKI